MKGIVLLRFVQARRPYNAGETAGFPAATARRLVVEGKGTTEYVDPPKGYDKFGARLEVEVAEIEEGLRHNGGSWYELVDHLDDNGKPVRVQGKAKALAMLEFLVAEAAAKDENPDKDDGSE